MRSACAFCVSMRASFAHGSSLIFDSSNLLRKFHSSPAAKVHIELPRWVANFRRHFIGGGVYIMNARKSFVLFLAVSLLGTSIGQADQAIGTAKARGDFRSYNQAQRSAARCVTRSRPAYRYSAPRSAPVIVESPVIREVPGPVVAQAPTDGRRFSQTPAMENEAATTSSTKPCSEPSSAAATSSGRRYSYAPTAGYSASPVRRYSGNARQSSRPNWSLQKTDPGKYNAR